MINSRFLLLKSLPLPTTGVITRGCGDFVFSRLDQTGQLKSISRSEYKAIYPLTRGWIHRPCTDIIRDQAQKILGQNVCSIFVPSTLYSLCFVEECIQERVNLLEEGKKPDDYRTRTMKSENEFQEIQKKNGFWPICHYSNEDYTGNQIADYKDARAIHMEEIASRLNEKIIVRLTNENTSLSPEGLSFAQIQNTTRNLIQFQKNMNNPEHPFFHRVYKAVQIERSILSNFFLYSQAEFAIDMNFPNISEIVENAVRLESSPEADNSVILYRGMRSKNESLVDKDGNPLSVCLGSRLLAGCIHDAGATALSYAGLHGRNIVAFTVPKTRLQQKLPPFFVPESSTLEQLCSGGESFHSRTVVPQDAKSQAIFGAPFMKNAKDLRVPQSAQEINAAFQVFLNNAVCLG
jgi:hypothetical protein